MDSVLLSLVECFLFTVVHPGPNPEGILVTLIQADGSPNTPLQTLRVNINQEPFRDIRNVEIIFQSQPKSPTTATAPNETNGCQRDTGKFGLEKHPRYKDLHI